MDEQVCIFVDGENFRYSIAALFESFNKADYLPDTDWALLFDWLAKKVCPQGSRKRTYWYVVDHLDFFPYRFPQLEKNPDELKKLLCKDKHLGKQLAALAQPVLKEKMHELREGLLKEMTKMKRRFEGWTAVQEGIALRNPAVTFRRAGAITYNLFKRTLGSEKAVDVKLACDLVLLRDIYDTAVIVSGDQDYVPAVEAVKEFGKSVWNVAFRTRGGRLLPGGARRLNVATDRCLEIGYDELAHYLGIEPHPRT